jgi:menaquinone reductase, multiheme cytochrome c subunit
MEAEKKAGASGKGIGTLFFFVGFIMSMILGWVVFPHVLYSQKAQPLSFRHSAHADSECVDCHRFRGDGTYTGIPNTDNCRQCHEEAQGTSAAEKVLVENYLQQNKEIPWLVYTRQPDNVYFSHAAHVKPKIDCVRCHRDVTKDEKLPLVLENRLTGYSKDTMKMTECEQCHAEHGASNACHVCHK